MSIKIPLNLQRPLSSTDGSTSTGIRLGLPLTPATGGAITFSGFGRDVATLRAVAGATALWDPRKGLELAKKAKETPEEVIAPALDKSLLGRLLAAVSQAQENRSDAPTPNDQHRAAARAIGANAVLVAAVSQEIESEGDENTREELVTNGLSWVAAVDGALLDRAARAGAKEKQLDLVPTTLTRLERLEKDMKDLKVRVGKLEEAFGGAGI